MKDFAFDQKGMTISQSNELIEFEASSILSDHTKQFDHSVAQQPKNTPDIARLNMMVSITSEKNCERANYSETKFTINK